MPRINYILDQLRETRNISSLDLKDGYWQIPLEEKAGNIRVSQWPFPLGVYNHSDSLGPSNWPQIATSSGNVTTLGGNVAAGDVCWRRCRCPLRCLLSSSSLFWHSGSWAVAVRELRR